MIGAIVSGAAGRMGQRIIRVISETEGIKLAGALDHPHHKSLGRDAGEVAAVGRLGIPIQSDIDKILPQAQVVIEFSAPEATLAHLDSISKAGKAMVIGTTGFRAEDQAYIRKQGEYIPVVFSPNMSVGVNMLFQLLPQIAKSLGHDYDIEIVEAHHRFKKDAPSGTALKMAQVIAEGRHQNLSETACYGRHGVVGERKSDEIGVHAVRAGDIVGTHTVLFSCLGESLEITHRAHSRDAFARGAVVAAKFAARAQPKLYDMQAVLGF